VGQLPEGGIILRPLPGFSRRKESKKMPLIKSASKKAVGKNILIERAAGKPMKQSIAIALSTQRKAAGKKPFRASKKGK